MTSPSSTKDLSSRLKTRAATSFVSAPPELSLLLISPNLVAPSRRSHRILSLCLARMISGNPFAGNPGFEAFKSRRSADLIELSTGACTRTPGVRQSFSNNLPDSLEIERSKARGSCSLCTKSQRYLAQQLRRFLCLSPQREENFLPRRFCRETGTNMPGPPGKISAAIERAVREGTLTECLSFLLTIPTSSSTSRTVSKRMGRRDRLGALLEHAGMQIKYKLLLDDFPSESTFEESPCTSAYRTTRWPGLARNSSLQYRAASLDL